MLNKLFEECVVLNVDKRIDEFPRIKNDLRNLGYTNPISSFVVGKGELLPYQDYDRIDEEKVSSEWLSGNFAKLPNSYHAFKSYQAIIGRLKNKGVKSVLLLEDDCIFVPGAEQVLTAADSELCNIQWDMLYLGANHTWANTWNISKHIMKINGSVCWHAVGLKHTVFDTILSWVPNKPIDTLAAQELHYQFKCYSIWPSVAIQEPGYSNVEGRNRDYSEFWSNKGMNNS